MLTIALLLVAAAMTTVAGIWQYRREHPDASRRLFNPGYLTALAGVLVGVAAITEWRSQTSEFDTTLGAITGADSFVYLQYESSTQELNVLDFVLGHQGRFTVHDIQVDMYRTDDEWRTTFEENGNLSPRHSQSAVAAMSPLHPQILMPELITAWDRNNVPEVSRFQVVITTRNGYFLQYIRLDNSGNDWTQSSVLFESGDRAKLRYSDGAHGELLDELSADLPIPGVVMRPRSSTTVVRRR